MFSSENQARVAANKAGTMLEDQDDEFLGCQRVGDSRSRNTSRLGRNANIPSQAKKVSQSMQLPPQLHFEHEGKEIHVECMLVEVKSLNDRLDARQEDWLNILDKHGNARVCKFGSKKV